MKIGLDIDGVLFDFVTSIHGMIPSIPLNPREADVAQYLKNEREVKLFNSLMQDPNYFAGLPTIPGIENLVPELNKHEVYVITSRGKKMVPMSDYQVRKLGINFKDLIATRQKGNSVEKLGCNVMIEDQIKYAQQVNPQRIVLMPERSYNDGFSPANVMKYKSIGKLISLLEVIEDTLTRRTR